MSLSTNQELAIRDDNGRLRCPECGRFRKLADFPDQPAHVRFEAPHVAGLVTVAPVCVGCVR